MRYLLEIPHTLLKKSPCTVGANKICRIMMHAFLQRKEHDYIILTDLSIEECKEFELQFKNQYPATTYFANYATIKTLIDEHSLMPDVGFVNDIKLHRLTYFRNINQYPFPVVGLIHSLGTLVAFKDFWAALPLLTPQDCFICPSDCTRETTKKLGLPLDQSTVLHYGCDLEQHKPVIDKTVLRQKHGLSNEKNVMLLLSRITPSHKMDFTPIVRMLPELIQKDPNLLFLIVGNVQDFDYVAQLKAFIKSIHCEQVVRWVHDPDQDRIEEYFQLSDFFISLSDFSGETYGLTIMEAMACGLPVIASDFSGYPMHFTHEKEGFYIPTTGASVDYDHTFYYQNSGEFGDNYAQSVAMDLAVVQERILELSLDPEKREKMGSAARQTIEGRNSLNHMIDNYISVFDERIQYSQDHPNTGFPPIVSVQQTLSHFLTEHLKPSDTFSLSESCIKQLNESQNFFIFQGHLERYFLIRPLLHLLSDGSKRLEELFALLKAPQSTIQQHLLYLLKQGFVIKK